MDPPCNNFYRHLARDGAARRASSPGDGDDTRPDKDFYRRGRARRIQARPNEDEPLLIGSVIVVVTERLVFLWKESVARQTRGGEMYV